MSNEEEQKVYVIDVDVFEKEEGRIFNIPIDKTVRFYLPSETPRVDFKTRLWTNYPIDGKDFQRSLFSSLKSESYNGQNDWVVDLKLTHSGSFEFYLAPEDDKGQNIYNAKTNCFMVDADITLNGKRIPIETLSLQTVVTKCLGPLENWPNILKTSQNAGFNCIHFTPVQQVGESNSAFSIYDQQRLSDSLFNDTLDEKTKRAKLKEMLMRLEKDFGLLAISDIVLNHTASNTPWLKDHPEAGYNLENSPHLIPAFELDDALMEFSDSHLGLQISNEEQLNQLMWEFRNAYLPRIRLWEYYVIDVETEVAKFHEAIKETFIDVSRLTLDDASRIKYADRVELLRRQGLFTLESVVRFPKKIRLDEALKFFNVPSSLVEDKPVKKSTEESKATDEQEKLQESIEINTVEKEVETRCQLYRRALNILNVALYAEYDSDVNTFMRNITSGVRYSRLAHHGPHVGAVSRKHPLVSSYFRRVYSDNETVGEAAMGGFRKDEEKPIAVMANNGWIINGNPEIDFAGPTSKAYLLREVLVWSDCVKLRYGQQPKDSPWLWDHMKQYVEGLAELFHGFRIDNCHSTPIHVARYLLDSARRKRNSLIVLAELFTGKVELDAKYVSQLGLTALIREAMAAHDSWELGRVVHRNGGIPVASMSETSPYFDYFPHSSHSSEYSPQTQHIVPSLPRALFVDCTHDNDMPAQKRTPEDTLPNSALVWMANCPVGTTRGYDELRPKLIDLVNETRKYRAFEDIPLPKTREEPGPIREFGIYPVRAVLNSIHHQLAVEGFTEIHVHQEREIIAVSRHHPSTHEAVHLIAHTAFRRNLIPEPYHDVNLSIPGALSKAILAARLSVPFLESDQFTEDPNELNGLNASLFLINNAFADTCVIKERPRDSLLFQEVRFLNFPPGSIVIFATRMPRNQSAALQELKGLLSSSTKPWYHKTPVSNPIPLVQPSVQSNGTKSLTLSLASIQLEAKEVETELESDDEFGLAINALSLVDLNVLLFRCDPEERDATGHGCFDIPNFGTLPYAGLYSLAKLFEQIAHNRDLSHPLLNNLREGNWLLDFICERLATPAPTTPRTPRSSRASRLASSNEATTTIPASFRGLHQWLTKCFDCCKRLQRHLLPKYVHLIVMKVYRAAIHRVFELMSPFVSRNKNEFVKALALTSVQMVGNNPTSPLITLPTNAYHRLPLRASMAAGLPHFSSGYMRSWGRDTMISLRGLLLVTGRFEEAHNLIVGFACCLRHGLIPNLLDSGRNTRYNARDAAFWFLQACQDFYSFLPPDEAFAMKSSLPTRHQFLHEKIVLRLFPDDDQQLHNERINNNQPPVMCSLADVIQEILQKHATGIRFREWNAGPSIDDKMSGPGFQVDVEVDPNSGLIFGGNRWNCGTWMDKMGESQLAGNSGHPSTPRNGAAIEIIGLLKSTLRWLSDLVEEGLFPHTGVHIKRHDRTELMTYKEWDSLVAQNFEQFFYVPLEGEHWESIHLNYSLFNRRGIYKDCHGSFPPYADYQLRPNVCVAMTVAPELFPKERAKRVLDLIEQTLIGPLGMRTLDPSDWNYRPNYDLQDSTDIHTARGANYHQGPEWVWPLGFFLRAKIAFSDAKTKTERQDFVASIKHSLKNHRDIVMNSVWGGVPELTNLNGTPCPGSCVSQAWSSATLLDALYDLHIFQAKHH